ncbi:GNAT family N-acetyltransferase [Vagococcus sp. BWB3-3]|uniref:GNAT family N-acetyltransferase n=1 Tax=Vagococcus allomyrinae TaxID=2794353 RepID=A0A940P7J4_9ENTE|nr:GNAT family N-acetyltransferase [Vagococcus allomyrinae]MBP1039505.1 GNAT family N-acetyltransferase [Vagococcus allomyrinae]
MITIGKLTDFTLTQVVTLFKERVAVFVVEQACPYQEIDEADYQATHIALWQGEELMAYTRVIDRGTEITFGRVLVTQAFRGQQLGRQIVSMTLAEIEKNYPDKPVQISAQAYLEKFYGSFGFEVISAEYLEDGIPHIDMVLH